MAAVILLFSSVAGTMFVEPLAMLEPSLMTQDCLYEVDVCTPYKSWIDVGSDGQGFSNSYSMRCECQGTTEVCTAYYNSLFCDMGEFDAAEVWLTQAQSPCCVTTEAPITTKTPVADEGCCYGLVPKCDTDEKSVCEKASKCEWREGQDADCAVTTTETPPSPVGCCYGADDACDTDDDAKCSARARKYGCEWRSGEDADCTVVVTTPEPGCCFGSSSRCDTDSEAQCTKNAARHNCEWRSGDAADCSTPEPESGCCYGDDAKCRTVDDSVCSKRARKYGCEWRAGEDADCSVMTAGPVSGCCAGTNSRCDTDDEDTCNKRARAGCEWLTGADANCDGAEAVLAVMEGAEVGAMATREWLAADWLVPLASVISAAFATQQMRRWCGHGAKGFASGQESQPLLTV